MKLGWLKYFPLSYSRRLFAGSHHHGEKAGTGKGNAFAAPGASYPYLELSRAHGQAMERQDLHNPAANHEREKKIKRLADIITVVSTRERVMKDIGKGARKARMGRDPLQGSLDCEGCTRNHGTHHFLCQAEERAKFKTRKEQEVYDLVKPALYKYAEEQRQALGLPNDPVNVPNGGIAIGTFFGTPVVWPSTFSKPRA